MHALRKHIHPDVESTCLFIRAPAARSTPASHRRAHPLTGTKLAVRQPGRHVTPVVSLLRPNNDVVRRLCQRATKTRRAGPRGHVVLAHLD